MSLDGPPRRLKESGWVLETRPASRAPMQQGQGRRCGPAEELEQGGRQVFEPTQGIEVHRGRSSQRNEIRDFDGQSCFDKGLLRAEPLK